MKKLILATCMSSLFLSVGAQAAPFVFSYSGAINSNGAQIGVANGTAVMIDVTVDNGGVDIFSQTWSSSDTVSAQFTAGGYTANWTTGFFPSSGFVTDAGGNLISDDWFGTSTWEGSDSLGNTEVRLYNGSLSFLGSGSTFYAPSLTVWQGPQQASVVPAPAGLALMGVGLLALGIRRRRRAR